VVEEDVRVMTTLPTWVVILLGLASPFVAVAALVVGWLGERGRQNHERILQKAEIENRRQSQLREERREAYTRFMVACDRLRGGDRSEEALATFRQTSTVAWLVSSSPGMRSCVQELGSFVLQEPQRDEDPDSEESDVVYGTILKRFLEAARRNLGIDSPKPGSEERE
jgi:hypothetical protein